MEVRAELLQKEKALSAARTAAHSTTIDVQEVRIATPPIATTIPLLACTLTHSLTPFCIYRSQVKYMN